jgi:hypothetical protein
MKQFLSILLAVSFLAFSSFALNSQPTPAAASAQAPMPIDPQDKPRIFVTDEPLHEGNFVAHGRAAAAHVESGPNARVVEIQSDLVKVCPKVTVTNRPDMADFTLLFRREGGKRSAMFAFGGLAGLALSAASKVDGASLFSSNGDLVTATKQRTVEKSIIEICAAIPATVTHAALQSAPVQQPSAAAEPIPAPIPPSQVAAEPSVTELTLISTPRGADVEVDGAFVGSTPSTLTLASGNHTVRVTKKGFQPYERNLRTSGGKINLNAELDRVGQ